MQEGSRRAIFAAFLANLGIAIAKFVGFFVTGAASMLAEAIHSVADTGNQGLLFLGGRRAEQEPNEDHPFGYGRERYFWAFVVSMLLFTAGGLFALFEGEEKLRHPHELESAGWAIGILAIAMVLEGYSLRTARQEAMQARQPGQSWWRFIREAKIPELPVVLLEDVGALFGLSFALLGVVLAQVTGDSRYDALGSIAIGLLLVFIASVLAVEMKSLLIGEAASPEQRRKIRHALESAPHVRCVIHMRTEHLGPDEVLVAAKLELDRDLTFAQLARAIDQAEAIVRNDVPAAKIIYIEPDLHRGT
jgi:cation diffusion facilitator family transporter